MTRVAWWTCALLAATLAHARIYDRCELARELQELGVHPDHISTWVCIAYHESRFDTGANNPHSGDHGLFQISELYWCGPGKACGLPCTALRDEDISDDLECALQVHEEHTRLQGDGFLAWVVYPHHCKHNTKKYLVNCDSSPKNYSAPVSAPRSLPAYENRYRTNVNIDALLPPYLTISSIFRGSYGKVLDHNKFNGVDWSNYKYDKVDELKLPNFASGEYRTPEPTLSTTLSTTTTTTTPTTTTTTTYVPPVKVWRVIESNQFRKKSLRIDRTTTKPTTLEGKSNSEYEKYSRSPSTKNPPTESTTNRPLTTVTVSDAYYPKAKAASYTSTTRLATTITPVNITFPTTYTTSSTTRKPSTESTNAISRTSTSGYRFQSRSTTSKPSTFPRFRFTNAPTTMKVSTNSTTSSPFSFPKSYFSFGTRSSSSTTRNPSTISTTRTTTARPMTKPLYTFITRDSTRTTQKTTETTRPYASTTSLRPSSSTTTSRPTTTMTRRPTTEKTSRATQSIFDLYLNPTKRPELPLFSFPSRGNSRFKFNIFADGTTTQSPSLKTEEEIKRERNQIRRQIRQL